KVVLPPVDRELEDGVKPIRPVQLWVGVLRSIRIKSNRVSDKIPMVNFRVARHERDTLVEGVMTMKPKVLDPIPAEQELVAEAAKDQIVNSPTIIRRHESLDHHFRE